MQDNSPLFMDILKGCRCIELLEGYVLSGIHMKRMCYMLADGIYQDWAIFSKRIHAPLNVKEQSYIKMQEAVLKDVERFFCVLQGRFRILRQEMHEWSDTKIIPISNVCVILHNMMNDIDKGGRLTKETDEKSAQDIRKISDIRIKDTGDENENSTEHNGGLPYLLERNRYVSSGTFYRELRNDLIDHV